MAGVSGGAAVTSDLVKLAAEVEEVGHEDAACDKLDDAVRVAALREHAVDGGVAERVPRDEHLEQRTVGVGVDSELLPLPVDDEVGEVEQKDAKKET